MQKMILHIRAVEAKDVPNMDAAGKSDPYLTFRVDQSEVIKTNFIKNTDAPKWNEEFHVPVPERNSVLHVELLDFDDVSADDLISTRDFELKNFKIGNVVDDWFEFFAAPKVKKPGNVHLVLHLANEGDEPFVQKQEEDEEVKERNVSADVQEENHEPQTLQEEEHHEPQTLQEEEHEPQTLQEEEHEPQTLQEEEHHEPQTLQEEEHHEPQTLQEEEHHEPQTLQASEPEQKVDDSVPGNVLTRDVNIQQANEDQKKDESVPVQSKTAAAPSKEFDDEYQLPFPESQCKIILLVIILVELFILFLKSKF